MTATSHSRVDGRMRKHELDAAVSPLSGTDGQGGPVLRPLVLCVVSLEDLTVNKIEQISVTGTWGGRRLTFPVPGGRTVARYRQDWGAWGIGQHHDSTILAQAVDNMGVQPDC